MNFDQEQDQFDFQDNLTIYNENYKIQEKYLIQNYDSNEVYSQSSFNNGKQEQKLNYNDENLLKQISPEIPNQRYQTQKRKNQYQNSLEGLSKPKKFVNKEQILNLNNENIDEEKQEQQYDQSNYQTKLNAEENNLMKDNDNQKLNKNQVFQLYINPNQSNLTTQQNLINNVQISSNQNTNTRNQQEECLAITELEQNIKKELSDKKKLDEFINILIILQKKLNSYRQLKLEIQKNQQENLQQLVDDHFEQFDLKKQQRSEEFLDIKMQKYVLEANHQYQLQQFYSFIEKFNQMFEIKIEHQFQFEQNVCINNNIYNLNKRIKEYQEEQKNFQLDLSVCQLIILYFSHFQSSPKEKSVLKQKNHIQVIFNFRQELTQPQDTPVLKLKKLEEILKQLKVVKKLKDEINKNHESQKKSLSSFSKYLTKVANFAFFMQDIYQ